MFVVYLATSALLLGLVAVTVFAALERLRTGGSSDAAADAEQGASRASMDGSVERLTTWLGLEVESKETDWDGAWWVCRSAEKVVGGRYVVLAAVAVGREQLLRLRDRVRAEGALKGIAVAAAGFDGFEPLVLDDVIVERLNPENIEALAETPSVASRPLPDSDDPSPSADRDEAPDESPT